MKKKNWQEGFTLFHILLVLLTGAAIIGAAYYVWEQQQIKEDEKVAARITSFEECVASGNPVMESHPRQCSADGQTFTEKVEKPGNIKKDHLVIEEWGVRAEITQEITPIYKWEQGDNYETVSVSSKELVKADPTNCSLDSNAGGHILRAKGTARYPDATDNESVEQIAKANSSRYVIIDDYYYLYEPPRFNCGHSSNAQDITVAAYKAMISGLEPIGR